LQLKALLKPFGLTRYYTDHWGAYSRHLDPDEHCPGTRNTQKIERKHLTLRTRIKRLARKTICFSKTTQMHDIVLDRARLDAARGAAVPRAAVATASRGVSTLRWWDAIRETELNRRRASAQPAARVSPGGRGPLRGHDGSMEGTSLLE
jgi:hypothetical protein